MNALIFLVRKDLKLYFSNRRSLVMSIAAPIVIAAFFGSLFGGGNDGKPSRVPVAVSGFKAPYPVSFVRDVAPVLSRLGCNAGTCHGSLEGKNGFKLSLRGYDPLYDHRALTDDLEGRRFNRAAPARSLMLMKPAGAVPHGGEIVFQGVHYQRRLANVRDQLADGFNQVAVLVNSPARRCRMACTCRAA